MLGGAAYIAAEQPLLLLMVILAVGGAIGSLHVRSFSLGPAAVLFTALAAASEAWSCDSPTVGYSVTYLFGVMGMLLAAAIGMRQAAPHGSHVPVLDDAVPPRLDGITVRVETTGLPSPGTWVEHYDHHIVFSRIMRGDFPGHPGAWTSPLTMRSPSPATSSP